MRTVLFVPSEVVIRAFCKFGVNVRREIPVTFVPTPPRYLALPRVVIELPTFRPLPHISQTLDMEDDFQTKRTVEAGDQMTVSSPK